MDITSLLSLTNTLMLIVIVILLSVTLLALRNKILFKMGVRNFRRRPKETVIVVAGLLVSTAIVSGSFVAGDTVNYMIEKVTYDALGAVDETVTVGGHSFFNYTAYESITTDPTVKSLTDAISPAITVIFLLLTTRTVASRRLPPKYTVPTFL